MKKIIIHDYAGHPFTFELCNELSKKYKIYYLYFANDIGPKADFKIKKNNNLIIKAVGKDINYNKKNFFNRFFQDIFYGIAVKKKINTIKPNLIISANCPTLAQEIILRAAKENNSKFIMWIQDIYSIATKRILTKKFLLVSFFVVFLFEFLEKRQVRLSDKLIIISKSFKKKLLSWDRKKNKLFFIPNWGNLKKIKIKPIDKNLYKKFSLRNKFRLVYTGTLGLKHNPNLILYIAKNNPDIELVISAAGSGFDSLKNNINLPTNIKLLPLLPFEIYNKILNSADIVFAMLNKEASQFSVPSKILNYLCAAKPIILSAPLNNLSSQIVNQSKSGKTFAPNDFNNLNSFFNHLKNNKKLRLKMGKNGRDYAKVNFNIKKITLKFENIFKELI